MMISGKAARANGCSTSPLHVSLAYKQCARTPIRARTHQRVALQRISAGFAEHLSMIVMDTRAFALPLQSPRVSNIRAKQGQTFPEMMIVVAIIAILAAVIIANLFHARGQAQVSAIEETEIQISSAVQMYFNDYGIYPVANGTPTVVTPAMFGGNGNPYYNSTPLGPNNVTKYVLNPGLMGFSYVILYQEYLDGGLMPNLKTWGSGLTAAPVPGTGEFTLYSPEAGVFAWP